jgi:hypothetical protein
MNPGSLLLIIAAILYLCGIFFSINNEMKKKDAKICILSQQVEDLLKERK